MIYPVFRENTQYDVMGRIVILDGVARGAPNPALRRLREMEAEVVRKSHRVQKILDQCARWENEVTGSPGFYQYNDSGSSYLNRYAGETCIKTLLNYNERNIRELDTEFEKLERVLDVLTGQARAKQHAYEVDRDSRERWNAQARAGLAQQRHMEMQVARGKDYHCAQ